jgi:hypothetical protein
MAELAGLETVIKISGAATTMTAEATTTSDNQSYQVSNAIKQVFDRDTPPTVNDDGSPTAEAYTVNYLNGTIAFDSVDAGRGPITVDGKYLPMTVAAYAHSMSDNETCSMLDKTPFGATRIKRKAGLLAKSGTLNQFNVTDSTYVTALLSGNPIVLEDRETSLSEPNRAWALLNSTQLAAAVSGMQDMIIAWTSKDEWIKLGG